MTVTERFLLKKRSFSAPRQHKVPGKSKRCMKQASRTKDEKRITDRSEGVPLEDASPQSGSRDPNLREKQSRGVPLSAPPSHRIALYLFLISFVIFSLSPVTMLLDTRFELLTSESLLRNQSVALNRFMIPGLDSQRLPVHPDPEADRPFYQLVRVGGKAVYRYPHGGSLLALPYIAVLDLAGISIVRGDGSYDVLAEVRLGKLLASLLMAVLVALFFETAARLVPPSYALAIAVAAGFGSQIWSNTSRALWSQTWEIFIAGWVIWLLLGAEEYRCAHGPDRLRPLLLATLLAWLYFVRPTGAIVVVCVALFVWRHYRRDFPAFALYGAAWGAAFIFYSLWTFGQPIPDYYLWFGRMGDTRQMEMALLAYLISPSRGLLVFTPALVMPLYLVTRHWCDLYHRWLALMSVAVIVWYVATVCAFSKWWGGWSYGPRLLGSLIPWWVLLAALGFQALLRYCGRQQANRSKALYRRVVVICGVFTAVIGIAINCWGANSWAPFLWNYAVQIDLHPQRVWNWSQAQFAAGWTNVASNRQ